MIEPQPSFTVSQLNRRVKDLLEVHFPLVWVEGEISNFSRPASGHWYFTLKDEQAQVACAMFKNRNRMIRFAPKVGDSVRVRARVSLYEGRGDFQLIVEFMEQSGAGLLQKRFEELKAKLDREGIFDQARKKSIPTYAQHLAVVTSPTGAAIRDVLAVLQRRFPGLPVTIVPSPVQGDGAAESLIKALRLADQTPRFDLILLCRGGGSLEDLWAFNDEALARAIADCHTPVICAVGHEIDFSIADFAADLRAATPSAAAELISPDQEELSKKFVYLRRQLSNRMQHLLLTRRQHLQQLRKQLKHPRERIERGYQRLDIIEQQMQRTIAFRLHTLTHRWQQAATRLDRQNPLDTLQRHNRRVDDLYQRIRRQLSVALALKRERYHGAVAALDIVSPLATIKRGYSIARNEDNTIVRSIDDVELNETLYVRVADGELHTKVNDKTPLPQSK